MQLQTMKIAYITAGAAGSYCGSCMHDNTLAAALHKLGHDALLIPTYTPIRTDESDVSQSRVFFGGINVYLQQKSALFRHTPWIFDRLLDAPGLLRWASRFAVKTRAEDLGDLTLSMLQGRHGKQKKELAKLVRWLKEEIRPDLIQLSNILLSGMVPSLREALPVPILGMLQGDDIFLEALPESFRIQAKDLIAQNCQGLAGYIATSRYYADFMANYLKLPRQRIDVVYPGLNLAGHGAPAPPPESRPFTIGYFARICPEKGLHVLVDAFVLLRKMPGTPRCLLHVSGWLGENQRPYLEEQRHKLRDAGLLDDFQHVDCPSHADKVRFLQGLDVLSVPTVYREPKGLYVLEAWANGVPVVQPRHGSFPELIEASGGGLLTAPEDPADLARALRRLMDDPQERRRLGGLGREAVQRDFHAAVMAERTLAVYRKHVPG